MIENNDINFGFETFLRFINKTLDKHAPIKTVKKRENKTISKLWITRGIKTSIKKRDKLYKQMIKAKNKQHKLIKHESYKKYRNKIIELIRQSKQTYYPRYFEQNKKDSKTIWQGIHEINGSNVSAIISDDNTITNPIEIAQNFNNFFTSIGTNFQKKIPPTKKKIYGLFEKTKP